MDYEFLTTDTVAAYIASKPGLSRIVDAANIVDVKEVGDGNLNLVFIVHDAQGGTVVIKQALPFVRLVGPEWPMTPFRAEREAEALRIHGSFNQELVPKLYLYDSERFVIAMENLSGYRVWRGALIEGLRHEGAAELVGQYVAGVAFGTSVIGMPADEQKILMSKSINTELCKITEDLVFTEPYDDIGRNSVLPANEVDAQALANDALMIHAMGEAKWKFMTNAEALIHGDLHTGSVMVRALNGDQGPSLAMAFDSEFSFYGPIAFDIGALWANYTLAAARAVALGNVEFAEWVLSLVGKTWDAFEKRFSKLYESRLDSRVWKAEMLEDRLAEWRSDAWLFSAAKMSRRIVGLAKAADIETLDPSLREGAARGVLELSRQLVRERNSDTSTSSFEALALETLTKHKTN
ncbi:S-methyl-5-thioribose kinase [Aquiluna sp.]|nr:S-methyl-5-thioribose kinase [Aquiluna sp.]MDA8927433.1 S-methyl-5-thioribose kinase [Aquiluna sp.]